MTSTVGRLHIAHLRLHIKKCIWILPALWLALSGQVIMDDAHPCTNEVTNNLFVWTVTVHDASIHLQQVANSNSK